MRNPILLTLLLLTALPDFSIAIALNDDSSSEPQPVMMHPKTGETSCNGKLSRLGTAVKVAALTGTVGIAAWTAYDFLSPTRRGERGSIQAINNFHKNYNPVEGTQTYLFIDDVFDLSAEEHKHTQALVKYLIEDGPRRRVRKLGVVSRVTVVRDKLDEKIFISPYDGEIDLYLNPGGGRD